MDSGALIIPKNKEHTRNINDVFCSIINLPNDVRIISAEYEHIEANSMLLSFLSPMMRSLMSASPAPSTIMLPHCSSKSIKNLLNIITKGYTQDCDPMFDISDVIDIVDTGKLIGVPITNLKRDIYYNNGVSKQAQTEYIEKSDDLDEKDKGSKQVKEEYVEMKDDLDEKYKGIKIESISDNVVDDNDKKDIKSYIFDNQTEFEREINKLSDDIINDLTDIEILSDTKEQYTIDPRVLKTLDDKSENIGHLAEEIIQDMFYDEKMDTIKKEYKGLSNNIMTINDSTCDITEDIIKDKNSIHSQLYEKVNRIKEVNDGLNNCVMNFSETVCDDNSAPFEDCKNVFSLDKDTVKNMYTIENKTVNTIEEKTVYQSNGVMDLSFSATDTNKGKATDVIIAKEDVKDICDDNHMIHDNNNPTRNKSYDTIDMDIISTDNATTAILSQEERTNEKITAEDKGHKKSGINSGISVDELLVEHDEHESYNVLEETIIDDNKEGFDIIETDEETDLNNLYDLLDETIIDENKDTNHISETVKDSGIVNEDVLNGSVTKGVSVPDQIEENKLDLDAMMDEAIDINNKTLDFLSNDRSITINEDNIKTNDDLDKFDQIRERRQPKNIIKEKIEELEQAKNIIKEKIEELDQESISSDILLDQNEKEVNYDESYNMIMGIKSKLNRILKKRKTRKRKIKNHKKISKKKEKNISDIGYNKDGCSVDTFDQKDQTNACVNKTEGINSTLPILQNIASNEESIEQNYSSSKTNKIISNNNSILSTRCQVCFRNLKSESVIKQHYILHFKAELEKYYADLVLDTKCFCNKLYSKEFLGIKHIAFDHKIMNAILISKGFQPFDLRNGRIKVINKDVNKNYFKKKKVTEISNEETKNDKMMTELAADELLSNEHIEKSNSYVDRYLTVHMENKNYFKKKITKTSNEEATMNDEIVKGLAPNEVILIDDLISDEHIEEIDSYIGKPYDISSEIEPQLEQINQDKTKKGKLIKELANNEVILIDDIISDEHIEKNYSYIIQSCDMPLKIEHQLKQTKDKLIKEKRVNEIILNDELLLDEHVEKRETNIDKFNDMPLKIESLQEQSNKQEIVSVKSTLNSLENGATENNGTQISINENIDIAEKFSDDEFSDHHEKMKISSGGACNMNIQSECNQRKMSKEKMKRIIRSVNEEIILEKNEINEGDRPENEYLGPKEKSSGKCTFCGKIFKDNYKLNRHVMSHTGGRKKSFSCQLCEKSFDYKHILNRHQMVHTGEKPFECELCKKRFSRKYELTHHKFNWCPQKTDLSKTSIQAITK